jgi:serine protease
MARMNRLLSAVCLGIAATAAVSAVVVAVERNPVHRNPQSLNPTGPARVIVKFKSDASVLSSMKSIQSTSGSTRNGVHAASVMQARLGIALSDGRTLNERTQVLTSQSASSSALVAALSSDADVEWAVVDERRYVQSAPVNDPRYPDNLSTGVAPTGPSSGQWYLRAPGLDASGRNVVSGINIEPAWVITHGSSAIVIGDVDTGITPHPDLDSKIFAATFSGTTSSTPYGYDFVGWGATHDLDNLGSESSSNALASANDGSLADADPSDPGDWVTAAEDVSLCKDTAPGSAAPSSWHGTQTASVLAAATNNGQGMAGVGYDTMVVPARALGKCGGYDSDIIAATEWAGGIAVADVPTNIHPARVVNMSLGGDGSCNAAYVDAFTQLRNRGVIVVAAAGNGNANNLGIAVSTPANCKPATSDTNKTPIVIAVAALRHAGTKVGFSNLGSEVTIAAPGGNCVNSSVDAQHLCLYPIITAINSGSTTLVANGGTYSDGLNSTSLGTSFSTPMVAGTVALILAAQPNLTNQLVIDILKSTARQFPLVSDTTPTPPVCTAPTSNSSGQDECICTTSTCGAGMLDAGAAVTLASTISPSARAPTAVVSPTTSSVAVGSMVTLGGSGSIVGSSGTALTYQWTIPDSDTFITLGASTGSSVVVTGAKAGTGQVQLTVFDSTTGLSNSATVSVTVTAAPASTGGGGGGGGAANPAWLAALALAGLLLGSRTRGKRA